MFFCFTYHISSEKNSGHDYVLEKETHKSQVVRETCF